jgi:restriction endonuclease S subunit
MVKLANISEIQTGLVLARKRAVAKDKDTTKYKALTLKSFDPSGFLELNSLDWFISKGKLEERYLTKKGDIIIRLTNPYTALPIETNSEGLVIPSNFAIIRLIDNSFSSNYVSLVLNSENIEKIFHQSAVSSTIPLIKTSQLRDIEINHKPIEIQEKIVELNRLQQKEGKLLNELNEQKRNLAKYYIGKIIMEE